MTYYLPKPEKFQDADSVLPGARIELKTAETDIDAQDPLTYAGPGGSVQPADGAVETNVLWAGVALHAASAGEEVAVVVYGPATVAKQAATAWTTGNAIGIGTGTPVTIQVQADTDPFTMFLGYSMTDVDAGDTSAVVFVK